MGDDAEAPDPELAAKDDSEALAAAGGGSARHLLVPVHALAEHNNNHHAQLTDCLIALVQGEQELKDQMAALRKEKADDLAALRAELQRFKDDTNAEMDTVRSGQEKMAAATQETIGSSMGEDLQAALEADSELNQIKAKMSNIESLTNAHEDILKRQADQIEADKAAMDVLAGLDRGAFNADIDADDEDAMENSDLFKSVQNRANAIATSTKSLMLGAMGAPSTPEARMSVAFTKWKQAVADQIQERLLAEGDAEAEKKDAEAKEARAMVDAAAKKQAEQTEAAVLASVTRKLQDKLLFARLESKIQTLADKQTSDGDLLGELTKLKAECEGLERGLRNADATATAANEAAATAELRCQTAEQKLQEVMKDVAPLTALPPAVQQMMGDINGKTSLDKFALLEEEVRKLQTKTGDGLPPELQDMLKELSGLGAMKTELQSHAKSLASLFNEKATEADLLGARNDTKSVDERLSEEIERRAAALQAAMDKARSDWESGIGKLNSQIADKPDSNWLSDFEQQIRDEMARLRAEGQNTITKEELEEQLRKLRAKLAAMGGGGGSADGGSAVFATCLACDRPLPVPEKWKETPTDYSSAGLSNNRSRSSGARQRRPRSGDGRYRTKSIESPAFHRPRSAAGSRVGVTLSGNLAYGDGSQSADYAVASVGGSLEPMGRRDDQPEVVMRGGFPMMNPKVRPHERSEDHSRLFGRNDALSGIHTRSADPVMGS